MPEDPTLYKVTKNDSEESLENKENSGECSRSEKNSAEYSRDSMNTQTYSKDSKSVHTIPSLTIRINNLQFRSTSQSSGEFIKWSVNSLHNKLLEYLDNGWEDHGDIITKGHVSMQKSLFGLPETCIVIAFLKACPDENCCKLTSVGPRLLSLSPSERDEFFEVYTLAETKLLNLSNESDEQN